jgi:hypothetical protein
MEGELTPASGMASQADALAKLEIEGTTKWQVVRGGTFLVSLLLLLAKE